MTVTAATLGSTLKSTLYELFANRSQGSEALHLGVAALEELFAGHPLLMKFDNFVNGDFDYDEHEVTFNLMAPLVLSASTAFEMRLAIVQDENEARLEVGTRYIWFKVNPGIDSRILVTLKESDSDSLCLDEASDIDAELETILRRQIMFMVDALTFSGEGLYGNTSDKYKTVFRDMAMERLAPPAFLDLA